MVGYECLVGIIIKKLTLILLCAMLVRVVIVDAVYMNTQKCVV